MGLKRACLSTKSPSNIALVKYWGKRELQLPENPSLSFTLTHCITETTLSVTEQRAGGAGIKVFFQGRHKPEFEPKIASFFERLAPELPFIRDYDFEVHTSNNFPHSSGIASSASGISALALALVELERDLGAALDPPAAQRRASALARLGSGSACRSVYKGLVVWGQLPAIPGSSDAYAIPYPHPVHPLFQEFQDTILVIQKMEKRISSSLGHELMRKNPYSKARFKAAKDNLESMIGILEAGDLENFALLVEHEALSLHAMMMTSKPAYLLMLPDTLHVLQKVWDYRKQTGQPLCFSLDAGANVHLLYPKAQQQPILKFIREELLMHCEGGLCVEDQVAY